MKVRVEKPMEYKIAMEQSTCRLEWLVRDMILDGWEPIGGIAFTDNKMEFYQAMIRRFRSK